MIDVIPARPFMAAQLRLQDVQQRSGQIMTQASLEMAIGGGMALAAVDGASVYAMAGIYEIWPGRGMAWALLSEGKPQHFPVLFRLMQRALDVTPLRRVEAYVFDAHEEGHRLMKMLGFANEGLQRAFWQDQDFALYARVQP